MTPSKRLPHLKIFLSLLAVLGIGAMTVWLRLSIVGRTYQLNQLGIEWDRVQREQSKLEIRLAEARSPKRLEKIARTQTRLVPPQPHQLKTWPLEPQTHLEPRSGHDIHADRGPGAR